MSSLLLLWSGSGQRGADARASVVWMGPVCRCRCLCRPLELRPCGSADAPPGSDPALLRAHIQKLDPAIDDDYFAHLWQLLVRKPNVEVVVAEDDEEGDLRPVGEDEEFPARNLAGLLLKYPRVRVRGSDDEIYYRLTGSRKRVSCELFDLQLTRQITKITPMIFNFLQVAARSRAAGMSAVELGPLFGCNQKSVFHYMKVLIQLGLCAKVPASLNGSSTSLLVYRRFLEQNPQYRAHQRLDEVDVKNEVADEEDGSAAPEAGVDGQSLGFDFQPFSEAELAAGHIPKERLLKVLESPGLRNHLLGNHNLLQVLGWPADDWLTRHRRQLQRHIATLVNDDIVEYVDVGNAQRACLRLTKYNPDFKPKEKDDSDDIEEVNEVPLNSELEEVKGELTCSRRLCAAVSVSRHSENAPARRGPVQLPTPGGKGSRCNAG